MFYDFIIPNKFNNFTTRGRMRRTVINLTACRVATAGPTPYSEPTRLMPLIPPGAAPSIVVIMSTPRILLVHKPITSPVKTKVNVIKIAGFHKVCNSTKEFFVRLVPIKAPARGAAGIPVFKANPPKIAPPTR